MGRKRRSKGRDVNGILLLDKPQGMSSNQALQRVKALYQAQKAGHTGSLDPLATGVLPLCFGEATKISGFMLDADKRYQVVIRLGEKTTTADAEGEVLATADYSQVSQADVLQALEHFTGQQQQLPPMYSAVKHQGQRLYQLARQGREVERLPRDITIYQLDLLHFELPLIELNVHCSKGTYIRTLAEDLAEHLGSVAHVEALRRTAVGGFDAQPVEMAALEAAAQQGIAALDGLLLPSDSAILDWPSLELNSDMAFYICQGQAVMVPRAPASGLVRLYRPEHEFIGIGRIQSDGRVAPKRLMLTKAK